MVGEPAARAVSAALDVVHAERGQRARVRLTAILLAFTPGYILPHGIGEAVYIADRIW